ncbi:MAG: 50S ribosomal protein L18e [Candidatus Woesearchaeota archaeon]
MRPNRKNQALATLITELKRQASTQEASIWKRIATDLEKPTRQRRVVNVFSIDKHSKEDDVVIVPGKVLGVGELNHKVTVAALAFSDEAKEKIDAKGKTMDIKELMAQRPKGEKVRILG